MRLWQRIIAALMILAISPAMVLAAMPVVLCISTGHQALEYADLKHDGRHAQHDALGSDHSDGDDRSATSLPCQDWNIAAAADAARLGAVDGVISTEMRVSTALGVPFPPATVKPSPGAWGFAQRARAGTPQRLALRSVVLLN